MSDWHYWNWQYLLPFAALLGFILLAGWVWAKIPNKFLAATAAGLLWFTGMVAMLVPAYIPTPGPAGLKGGSTGWDGVAAAVYAEA